MTPEVATLAAVISVAAATMAMRSGPVGDAERARLLLAAATSRSCASAARPARRCRSATGPAQRQQIGDGGRGEAAEQPERHGGKLVVGIGEILHQADAGAEQRADHDAGQHQDQDRIARRAAPSRSDRRPRPPRARPRRRSPRCRRRRARRRCRAPRRAPRPRRRRGCRATPADCGTGPGTPRRRPRAPRRPAQRRAMRGPRTSRMTFSTAAGTSGVRPVERRREHVEEVGKADRIAPDREGENKPQRARTASDAMPRPGSAERVTARAKHGGRSARRSR